MVGKDFIESQFSRVVNMPFQSAWAALPYRHTHFLNDSRESAGIYVAGVCGCGREMKNL
jgi:hypothetical protein